MFEVYTGHKPGRPVLLLTISAAALFATLGAAWLQVQNRRALGPAVRLEDAPLVVRPPRGWVRDRKNSNRFLLPLDSSGRSREQREILFDYRRWPRFVAPEESLSADLGVRFATGDLQSARIGPFEGVQLVRREQPRPWRRSDAVIRRACSPQGDEITVLYFPLSELTYADLALIDDVCAAVQLLE